MHDYWNDPPEPRDPPACPNDKPSCGGSGEFLYEGKTGYVFSCDTCGYQWVVPFPVDSDQPSTEDHGEPEEVSPDDSPQPKHCPHGREWGSCDACDHLSDLAYDAARERRMR